MDRGQNKRLYERIVLDSERIFDLSEGGVYVKTKEPRRLGSLVGLEMKLFEGENPVLVRGRIIRIIYEKGGLKRLPPGMAVQFDNLSEADRERIRTFISRKKAAGS